MKRKILFLTATRADYGKMKPIIRKVHEADGFESHIFVTGMHMLARYGSTYEHVVEDGLGVIACDMNYSYEPRMEYALNMVLANFSKQVKTTAPDMIVVHGDRLDAMAGALVGAFNNILVAHIEGGEVSGTIDESIRHAVSKLAHVHFTANAESKKRLVRMGEPTNHIHVIGSPDIDVMLGDGLPPLSEVFRRYAIRFNDGYAILMFHPVVTEREDTSGQISEILEAAKNCGKPFVVIYPNNDPGNDAIRAAYEDLPNQFRVFPSMRFEYFLSLLKNSEFIVGNSSAGIREACVYGIPAIDVGSRQMGRYDSTILRNIIHVEPQANVILEAFERTKDHRFVSNHFGFGDSADRFMAIICDPTFWDTPLQKRFADIEDGYF